MEEWTNHFGSILSRTRIGIQMIDFRGFSFGAFLSLSVSLPPLSLPTFIYAKIWTTLRKRAQNDWNSFLFSINQPSTEFANGRKGACHNLCYIQDNTWHLVLANLWLHSSLFRGAQYKIRSSKYLPRHPKSLSVYPYKVHISKTGNFFYPRQLKEMKRGAKRNF